jgi:hypothetical protein
MKQKSRNDEISPIHMLNRVHTHAESSFKECRRRSYWFEYAGRGCVPVRSPDMKTTGIVDVAESAACAAAVPKATITSTLERTRSAVTLSGAKPITQSAHSSLTMNG